MTRSLEAPPTARERSVAVQILATPDYRNYWFGSIAFALGIWAFLVSMGYSAATLTDSPFLISLVSVAYFTPMFVLALPSGVLADAYDRRATVIVCRLVSAVAALVLSALTFAGALGYVGLLALCFVTGATVVLEVAARQAYVTQIVRPEQVAGATALGSVQGGVARVIGPLIAGATIALAGQPAGYLFFAVTNLLCVVAFLRIKASGRPPRAPGRPVAELVDGLRYLRGHADASTVAGVGILTGVVGWVSVALLPSVNSQTLGGGAVRLAVLSAAYGVGSVPPSILLAIRSGHPPHEGALYFGATFAWALGVIAFALTSSFAVACVALAVAGAGNGVQQTLMRTLLLRITDPAYHGRVMGTLMLTWGANIAGTLTGGILAETLGVATVIAGSGVLIALIALGFLARRPSAWRL